MQRFIRAACLFALVISGCSARGDSGLGDGSSDGRLDGMNSDAADTSDHGTDVATDRPDGPGPDAQGCRFDDDCTAPDLCTNARRCVNFQCVVVGGPMNCDDNISCTDDSCSVTLGRCVHVPNDMRCTTGEFCDPMDGCVHSLPCEVGDTTCMRLNTDPCMGTWSCDPARLVCVKSLPPNCSDSDACTTDGCMDSGDTYMCTHTLLYNYATDPMHCGGCTMPCPMRANATAGCAMSDCTWMCNTGYVDLNMDLNATPRTATSDGCECHVVAGPDNPDLMFVDSDCDGIDGTIANGVFVSTTGSDSNDGTMAHPLLTIAAGIQMAAGASPHKQVYVAKGIYAESVTLTNGVSIYGGYDDTNHWSRAMANTTTIQSPTNIGVSASALSAPTEVQLFTIVAADATNVGDSSYGVLASNAQALTLRGDEIHGGYAMYGPDGMSGTPGAPGGDGVAGTGGGTGGAGGSPSCGGGATGPGGAGGDAVSGSVTGNGGLNGTSVSGGGLGGNGGTGGSAGSCPLIGNSTPGGNAPNNANPGTVGLNGINAGTQSNVVGSLTGGTYTPPAAGGGTRGTAGGGGGGGGSGGGAIYHDSVTCTAHPSGSGGGGGGGGCGGGGAGGGSGGGGSFAVVSVSSNLTIDHCGMFTGRGGDGGNGGVGGLGGYGGQGGAGGPAPTSYSGAGAQGGVGGNGGSGGNGSGGPGGPSACVIYTGTMPTQTNTMCSLGQGGRGGRGGNNVLGPASDGLSGIAMPTISAF